MASELTAALEPLTHAFSVLGIDYRIGGSVASSVYGVMRATYDVDLVANVAPAHATPLAAMLAPDYYVDEELIRHALRHGTSFNVIYFASMLKIDVFTLGTTTYDASAFARYSRRSLSETDATEFSLSTPEDVVIRKLDWHRRGGGASDQQLQDIVHVLQVQRGRLDLEYMLRWASELDLLGELNECLARANPGPEPLGDTR